MRGGEGRHAGAAAWDCGEGTIQITANAEASPTVAVLSSDGAATAQRGAGPHPAGRTVYGAPPPEDPILSIRAVLADGMAVSVASEVVRTEERCAGEAVFREYGMPAPPAQRQPAAPSDPAAQGDAERRPAAPAQEQPQPAGAPDEPGAPADPPAIEIPPPPPDPSADDRQPGEAADRPPPPPPTAARAIHRPSLPPRRMRATRAAA